MVGALIRNTRLELGLTQKELAGREMTQAFISLVEREKVTPSLEALEIIARRLGKPVMYFVDQVEQRKSVDALTGAVDSLLAAHQFDEAERVARTALELSANLHTPDQLGMAKVLLAKILQLRGDYEAAIDLLEEAIGTQHLLPELFRDNCLQIGNCYFRLSQFRTAYRWFHKGFRMIMESSLRFQFALFLGRTCYSIGNIAEAMDDFRLAESAATSMEGQAEARVGIGLCQYEQGEIAQAVKWLSSALEVFEQVGSADEVALCRLHIARVQIDAGDVLDAEQVVRECERHFSSNGLDEPLAVTLEVAALARLHRCSLESAVQYCDRALVLNGADTLTRGRLHRLKGVSLLRLGETRLGLRELEHSADIFCLTGANRELAKTAEVRVRTLNKNGAPSWTV